MVSFRDLKETQIFIEVSKPKYYQPQKPSVRTYSKWKKTPQGKWTVDVEKDVELMGITVKDI